jgi:hypothetical protein
MPCPHAADKSRLFAVSRRGFLASALSIGGSAALGACLEREDTAAVGRGPSDPSNLPSRQYAWNDWLPHGRHGNPSIPRHQLVLCWNYRNAGTPTDAERERIERAFRALDRAYQRGTGDEFNPSSTDGLLYFVGYSPSYFDRYDEPLPNDVDLQRPTEIIDTLGESAASDEFDVVLLLSSDAVQVLLSTELALLGELTEINGVEMTSFDGVLELAERRTGFLGKGRPAEELSVEGIPDESPTAMGFRSSFQDNQASEDAVSIPGGRFANGSTLQLSRLVFDLTSDGPADTGWYDRTREERTSLMFSPEHTPEDVGRIGERLAGRSQVDRGTVEDTHEIARRERMVGHTQKVAAARTDAFEPKILRRSEGVSIDLAEPSMNFLSLQRRLEDFIETREAMNGSHLDIDVPDDNDGIQNYVSVQRRATFLVPPRRLRALPTPIKH